MLGFLQEASRVLLLPKRIFCEHFLITRRKIHSFLTSKCCVWDMLSIWFQSWMGIFHPCAGDMGVAIAVILDFYLTP